MCLMCRNMRCYMCGAVFLLGQKYCFKCKHDVVGPLSED